MKQTVCSVGDAILLERFPKEYDTIKDGVIEVMFDD